MGSDHVPLITNFIGQVHRGYSDLRANGWKKGNVGTRFKRLGLILSGDQSSLFSLISLEIAAWR
ncbi:conserved hypothetical protein [Ricinus communis]|uniref:Uncharacterized protein n=1 Tax=Ricinus communis TaxID=3988 RepID=B9S0W0_RICCO|nr:conserved hypothetical protein [Ricinus communis]